MPVIHLNNYRKTPEVAKLYEKDGEPTVRALWERIRTDMRMGVTFWDYATKCQLDSPYDVLEHFLCHIDLQIRMPLDENGEPVVMCDARKKGEDCPLCEPMNGKVEDS